MEHLSRFANYNAFLESQKWPTYRNDCKKITRKTICVASRLKAFIAFGGDRSSLLVLPIPVATNRRLSGSGIAIMVGAVSTEINASEHGICVCVGIAVRVLPHHKRRQRYIGYGEQVSYHRISEIVRDIYARRALPSVNVRIADTIS